MNGFLLGAPIKHDFLARPIALDIAIAVFASKEAIHGQFDSLNAFPVVIQESEDMSE